MKWTVYSLDVWGNEEDGFEVNDRSKVGTIETPDENPTEIQIWNALQAADLITGRMHQACFVWGDESFLSIDEARTQRPILQLEAITVSAAELQ